MKYRWEMRDRQTGEVRSSVEEIANADFDAVEFIWTEGNQSCDVNRGAAFYECDYTPDRHDCMLMPDLSQRFELLSLTPLDK